MTPLNKNWNSLIKLDKLVYENVKNSSNTAKVVVEPLERGYGTTIGNALRRVLLSSLQGTAITSFKIPGVLHEYSAIDGVKEDVVDIVLNLKQVAIRMHSSEPKTLRLKAKGPCVVTTEMIDVDHTVEILDPNQVICTLAEDAELEIELVCENGKGYVPALLNSSNRTSIESISIDALFNPVKKVAYKVENARVGQVTDYDKLIMTVETNGSISPEMAVALAARILQDQLQSFIMFKEEVEDKRDKLEELPFNPVLLKKVDELELSVRSQNCLKNDNIVYIGDLVIKSEAEMLKTQNFGRKSLNEIKDILLGLDLKFGMEVKNWPPENLEELSKKHEEPY
ncbi:MAG: DNA-directed RNA polymerase subunit alpha [Rickettsiaceae bacterium]|nr:MAG: DNA-directed RNA polymerase subunit alpha [Rickettsiaceae bacterium]